MPGDPEGDAVRRRRRVIGSVLLAFGVISLAVALYLLPIDALARQAHSAPFWVAVLMVGYVPAVYFFLQGAHYLRADPR